MYYKLLKNVQNIRWNHKLYQENPENRQSGINSMRERLSWSEGRKRYISRRCIIIVTIHKSDDTTYTKNAQLGTNLVNCKKRSITLCTWTTSNYLQKLKNNWDIQSGYRNGIWHRKMGQASNKKRLTKPDGRNRTTKSKQDLNAQRNGNLEILGHFGSRHHQTSVNEKKIRGTRKLLETKLCSRNFIKRINTWVVPSLDIRHPFLSGPEKNLSKWTKEQKTYWPCFRHYIS